MARTLLFLCADALHASIWRSGKLDGSQHFSNDTNGREAFSAFLKQHRAPAYLLVDVIEEDFRMETVPHVIGPARRDLLARKFEQFYRSTPFRQASVLQRRTEGRRDDEMLFSALTNPQRISPWLEALQANHTPLAGIYSVPSISTPLLKGIPTDHVLLLSWEKNAGLRQTYFNNKHLYFSRLIPISEGGTFAEAVAAETPRTQQYLKSLSLPPPGVTLDVYIICNNADRPAIQAGLEASSELRYTYLDLEQLGKRFHAKDDYRDSDATHLFLHLLATMRPSGHYANTGHTHFYLLWELRRILFGLAAVTMVFSVLLSGTEFLQARHSVAETEPLNLRAENIWQQTQQIQQSFANTTVPAADMKTAVLLMRKLDQYSPPPADYLRGLTRVLDTFTQIEVDSISWKASGADAAPSAYPAQVITLDGSLAGFGSDYRKAFGYLDRFQQALSQQGYTVSTQKLPMDISSQGSISGDVQRNDGSAAQFTLKIIWRRKE